MTLKSPQFVRLRKTTEYSKLITRSLGNFTPFKRCLYTRTTYSDRDCVDRSVCQFPLSYPNQS